MPGTTAATNARRAGVALIGGVALVAGCHRTAIDRRNDPDVIAVPASESIRTPPPRLDTGRVPMAVDSAPRQPRLTLVLNLPAKRLDAYVDGHRSATYRVAVGMPRYQTPLGDFTITSIEWNPWWIPPPSAWAKHEKPTPPGAQNPMGRVKLYFRELYFLHGTPLESSIGKAASHGCVRLRNRDAIALARLVHRFGTPAVPRARIDSAARDTTKATRFVLDHEVPIELRYERLERRGDTLLAHPNIYGLSEPLTVDSVVPLLESAGAPPAAVDTQRIARLLQRARRGTASAIVESLLARP